MRLLLFIIESVVIFFSTWTFSYHVLLFLQLPAVFIYLPMLITLVCICLRAEKQRGKLLRDMESYKRTLVFIFLLGGALAIRSLFLGHMNPDDFVYYRDTLIQLNHLWEPFFINEMSHDIPLPPISPLHLLSSYEKLCGFSAILLNLDPLWMLHVAAPFLASFLVPIILYLVYRYLGIGNKMSVTCTLFSIIFLSIDGAPAGAFGNIAFNGLWIGKCILWAIGIPLVYLMCLAYFKRPTLYRMYLLAATSICGIGLNNSAIFLFPMLVTVIAVAYIAAKPSRIKNIKKNSALIFATLYPVIIYFLIVVNMIKMPENMAVWETGWWSANWLDNLKYRVLGDDITVTRNLLILILIPYVGMNQTTSKRFIIYVTLAGLAFYANPVSAPLWLSLVKPASYWRIAYIFPLQIAAGLLPLALYKITRQNISLNNVFAATSVLIVAGIFFCSFTNTALAPVFKLSTKTPMQYRLFGDNYTFSEEIKNMVSFRIMLAPATITLTLGLLNPDVRFYVTSRTITTHQFTNIGRTKEVVSRAKASRFIEGLYSDTTPILLAIEKGVNALVIKTGSTSEKILLEFLDSNQWKLVHESSGYKLLLKDIAQKLHTPST